MVHFLTSDNWRDYELLDSGGGQKLERFGKYVFVIETSSFERSVGSPLPYEFDCQNFSLEIAFQGGDSQYAVGAFSIKNSTFEFLVIELKNNSNLCAN